MRVATNIFPDRLVAQLNQLNARQNLLQNQAATGQRVQWGDDDPAAMQRALELQSDGRANEQRSKNVEFLSQRTTVALSSIQNIQDVLDRAGEIATLADGTKSRAQLRDYASEVDQLIRQAVTASNRQHQGDYLFGGTRSDRAPFALTENGDHQITGVSYEGNLDSSELQVGQTETLPVTMPGANGTGSGAHGLLADSRTGADVFAHLISLREHLTAGDTDAIASNDRAAIGRDEENVLYHLANTGAIQARLESAGQLAASRASEIKQAVSRETDVDLAQTIVELTATQTAYRAALQSGASLLNTSLMDFLR